MSQVVLITGAGSGFGLLTAESLLDRGHHVVATLRDPAGRHRAAVEQLEARAARSDGKLEVVELDVTRDESVDTAVAEVLGRAGRIDVAVNNAGAGMSGLAEAFTAAEVRSLFEVNLFGAQRVNRAVLPSMRAAGSGLLIHVSSTFGRFVVPFVAPYTATKWALEALAESYRMELHGTGVEVAIVEPGAFVTGHAERIGSPVDAARVASYGELAERPGPMWGAFVEKLEAVAPDPQRVADCLVDLVEAPAGARPARVVVDPVGGGEAVEELNRAAERLREAYYTSIGISGAVPGGTDS